MQAEFYVILERQENYRGAVYARFIKATTNPPKNVEENQQVFKMVLNLADDALDYPTIEVDLDRVGISPEMKAELREWTDDDLDSD